MNPSYSSAISPILRHTTSTWNGDVFIPHVYCDVLSNVDNEKNYADLNLKSVNIIDGETAVGCIEVDNSTYVSTASIEYHENARKYVGLVSNSHSELSPITASKDIDISRKETSVEGFIPFLPLLNRV